MISIALVTLALAAAHPTDVPRKAYQQCLDQFLRKSLDDKVGPDAFEKALAAACADKEAVLKKVAIDFDVKDGVSRREAEQYISDEISDFQSNTRIMYRQYVDTNTKPG